MSIRFYDEAIVKKFTNWIGDPKMKVLAPNSVSHLFQIKEDETKDEILTLPLIAISRNPRFTLKTPTKRSLSYDGLNIEGNDDKTLKLNVMEIENLIYQIDIYTKRFDEADEYVRNFAFALANKPKMTVEIPYNDSKLEHICYLELQQDVEDTSDIPERLIKDEFTRFTLTVKINDAFFFSVPVSDNSKVIGAVLEIKNNNTDTKETEEASVIDLRK